jgi:D-amino-acid dehydrogenase
MADLTSQLERGGARFHWKAPVTAWRENSDGIAGVETPQGALTADHYVIAGGAWSGGLGKMLGWRLPLQAGKGYSITLPQPKRLPSLCSILAEARVAVTPMGSALRFGGTMEIAGLDESIAAERVQGIIESATAYLPEFRAEDFEGQPVWRGLRPCSPDGLPYVGRSPRHSNLWVATGHAMMGLSLGPATGRLMAQLLSGAAPEFDIALLDPGRYDGV